MSPLCLIMKGVGTKVSVCHVEFKVKTFSQLRYVITALNQLDRNNNRDSVVS